MQSEKTVFVHLIAIWPEMLVSTCTQKERVRKRMLVHIKTTATSNKNDSERYEMHLMEIYSHEISFIFQIVLIKNSVVGIII